MKLYLLERTDGVWYDEYGSFVVAALSHIQARKFANETSSDEGKIWDNRELVKATYLGPATKSVKKGIILGSYNAG